MSRAASPATRRPARRCRSTTRRCATRHDGTPLVVIAGKEYGTGSSRDWAAKGTVLLGVRAVIAESFERIHRSNLVGMGVLPLQFHDGESAETPRPRRQRDLHDHRRRRARAAAGRRRSQVTEADGSELQLHRPLPHRHLQRARIFPLRRHPPLRAAEAGGLSERAGRHVPLRPCEITVPRKPDQVTHCNCSLCTKTGFQGIYFASDELVIEGEFDRYVRADSNRRISLSSAAATAASSRTGCR